MRQKNVTTTGNFVSHPEKETWKIPKFDFEEECKLMYRDWWILGSHLYQNVRKGDGTSRTKVIKYLPCARERQ